MQAPCYYIGFVALSLVLFGASQVLTRRAGVQARLRLVAGALVMAVIAAGWPVAQLAGERARHGLAEMLMGYAPTYAAEMAAMGHADLTRATPPDDPAYQRMIEAEKRWLAANPSVNDIYT